MLKTISASEINPGNNTACSHARRKVCESSTHDMAVTNTYRTAWRIHNARNALQAREVSNRYMPDEAGRCL